MFKRFIPSALSRLVAPPRRALWHGCSKLRRSFGPHPVNQLVTDNFFRSNPWTRFGFPTLMDLIDLPPHQILTNDKAVQIALEVPGFKLDDIKVTFDTKAKVLSVEGQHASSDKEDETSEQNFRRSFAHQFALHESFLDNERMTANLKNGLLIITIPKDLESVKRNTRIIPVTTEDEMVADNINPDSTVDLTEK
jgi:HSP20 family molecular chaperone IbpA